MKVDISTCNIRIVKYLLKRIKSGGISGTYLGLDTSISEPSNPSNFTLKIKNISELCKELDCYVEKNNMDINHIKDADAIISRHGGYVIKEHKTGKVIKISRSILEEKIVKECQ